MATARKSEKPSILHFEKQFIFYASYHNNAINVLLHLLCIWTILASAVVFLQYTPAFVDMPHFVQKNLGFRLNVNAAFIYCLFYAVVYLGRNLDI
jgi:uncharacterized membrane protein YGL010W